VDRVRHGHDGRQLRAALQWWTATVDYPIIIAGKPYFSWQAFVPVTFELGVLFSAFGAVFGMLGLNKLPMWYHSLFNSRALPPLQRRPLLHRHRGARPQVRPRAHAQAARGLGRAHVEEVED
jgi:hypothetical protein